MLLSKKVLGIAECIEKDGSRPALKYLHIKGNTVQATNGHIIAKTSFPELDAGNFPITPGDDPGDKDIFITPDQLKAPFQIANKTRTLPILKNVCVTLDESGENSIVTGTDITNHVSNKAPQSDINYPNTAQVYPVNPAADCLDITLGTDALATLTTIIKKAGLKDTEIHLRIVDKTTGIKFYIVDPDGEPITGILMPSRNSDGDCTDKLNTVK